MDKIDLEWRARAGGSEENLNPLTSPALLRLSFIALHEYCRLVSVHTVLDTLLSELQRAQGQGSRGREAL